MVKWTKENRRSDGISSPGIVRLRAKCRLDDGVFSSTSGYQWWIENRELVTGKMALSLAEDIRGV